MPLWTIERASAALLVLGMAAFLPAGFMFWFRGGVQGRPVPSRTYFIVERSLVMAAVILTALGLVLLDGRLQDGGGRILSRLGAYGYLFAAILIVSAEALNLNGGYEKNYPLVVVYVVLAFLAQAVIGVSLLQAGPTPEWIGWLAIAWNIGWLVVLPLVSRRDIYFPVVHHCIPLVLGIALLWTP